jgi:hypothetical protein
MPSLLVRMPASPVEGGRTVCAVVASTDGVDVGRGVEVRVAVGRGVKVGVAVGKGVGVTKSRRSGGTLRVGTGVTGTQAEISMTSPFGAGA